MVGVLFLKEAELMRKKLGLKKKDKSPVRIRRVSWKWCIA